MRTVTGIELGGDSCALVRVRRDRGTVVVSQVHVADIDAQRAAGALTETLREARRTGRFSRRARVVAWGLHESASLSDAATRTTLAPVTDAGFAVDGLLRPADALALLARQRRTAAGRDAVAWLALNKEGAAIAIVRGGELLFSREIAWKYRPAPTPRAELLQRYSLIAHVAPELRHGFDMIAARHAARVDRIVTCGDLPDLRSLTMPLIEELDTEVETLDSMDGLDVEPPATRDDVADRVPALRLACAAAMDQTAERSFWRPALAAAALVLALLIWGALQSNRGTVDRGANTAVTQTAPPPRVDVPAAAKNPAFERRAPEAQVVIPPVVDPTEPAATTGRRGAHDLPETAGRSGRTTRGARAIEPPRRAAKEAAPAPLKAPMPVVNSILLSPDRRLAVVDGAIVREGDSIGPRVLVRIEADALVLREPSGYEVRVPIRRRVGSAVQDAGT
jgi:hypothetical protein